MIFYSWRTIRKACLQIFSWCTFTLVKRSNKPFLILYFFVKLFPLLCCSLILFSCSSPTTFIVRALMTLCHLQRFLLCFTLFIIIFYSLRFMRTLTVYDDSYLHSQRPRNTSPPHLDLWHRTASSALSCYPHFMREGVEKLQLNPNWLWHLENSLLCLRFQIKPWKIASWHCTISEWTKQHIHRGQRSPLWVLVLQHMVLLHML